MKHMNCIVEVTREWASKSGDAINRRWRIENVSDIHITGDVATLQDTCSIKLPKNVRWLGGYKKIPLRRGDYVRVWLGYDDDMKMRFCGYIKEISAKTPTTITVIDTMFVLQNTSCKMKTYANATLQEVLRDQLPNTIRWKSPHDVQLGNYRVTATNVAGVLQDLKENYGIYSTFVIDKESPLLMSYTVYPGIRRNAGLLKSGVNVISDDLKYRRREDIQVKVEGISIMPDGSRITYTEGQGDLHQIHRYNLSQKQLIAVVKDEIERLKWEGLSGNVTTFGEPYIEKLDTIDVEMDNVERGRYQVKGVNVSFNSGGYRQVVELGRLIFENE